MDRRERRMKKPDTAATEEIALRSLLGDATTLAADFLGDLPGRRVTPTATADGLREDAWRTASRGTTRTPTGRRRACEGRRARARWPRPAGGSSASSSAEPTRRPGRGLARLGLGSERCPLRSRPGSVGGRGGLRCWLADLLGLPQAVSYGLVTGAQMANFTALAAARHGVLERVGWDVEADGLSGAPRIRVIVGEERHVTIDRALRFLGFGTSCLRPVPADEQGRMRPEVLRSALAESSDPTIVCAQAGNVNTGAVDPLDAISGAAGEAGAWLHVDGAFGMWAARQPGHAASGKGHRARRLLVHRRPQVA